MGVQSCHVNSPFALIFRRHCIARLEVMLHGLTVENLLSTDVGGLSVMLLKQIYFNPQ